MIFRQSALRPFLGVCGLWCVLGGVVIGQNSKGKNEADFAVPNPNGTYSDPNSGSLPNSNTYRRPGFIVSGQQNFDAAQPRYAPNQGFQQPGVPSPLYFPAGVSPAPSFPQNNFPPAYGQPPQEMLIYAEGEFKIATQNLGDPKTSEAFNEGRRVMAEAVQVLRSETSSDESRAEAKKVMTKYLEAHFDHDQKKRRQQLETLEAQVVKLKAQLEKRSQSKEQLIELRLTLLENDASGLAFPQSWTQVPGLESPTSVMLQGSPYPPATSYSGSPNSGQFYLEYNSQPPGPPNAASKFIPDTTIPRGNSNPLDGSALAKPN